MGQTTNDSKRPLRARRKPAILLAAVALVALAVPAVADAKKGKKKGGQKVTVETLNVFLGADLGPATNATSIPDAIDGAGEVWTEFKSTKFEERVAPLVRGIKKAKPDLVGVQEVATWYKQTPSDGGAPPISPIASSTPATDVEQDFLALLEAQLKGKGPKYKVVDVQEESSAELPVDADQSNSTGTGPLASLGADFDARLVTHNVILARKGSKVKTRKTNQGLFSTIWTPDIGGVEIPVDRGWQSVVAKVKGKSGKRGKKATVGKKRKGAKRNRKFLFVNTHLEAFGEKTIKQAQAQELVDGPLDTKKQIVLVGDLNSGVARHNEPEEPGDELAFQVFEAAGFKDNGAKKLNGSYQQTCCYSDLFDPSQVFDHTVDHVLTKPGLKTKKAYATGNDPEERTASGLWPSDHGGKVARLQLKKK